MMKSKLMTKLALAAFAVALTNGANATSFIWRASWVNASDDTSISSSGVYSMYVFASADGAGTFSTTSMADVKAELAKGKNGSLSSLSVANAFNTSYQKGTATFEITKTATPTSEASVSFFALLLDSTSVDSAKNYMFAKTKDGGNEYLTQTVPANQSSGNQTVTFDWKAQDNNSWTSIATIIVPEPTSGVLLLIGVAALALRRKRVA